MSGDDVHHRFNAESSKVPTVDAISTGRYLEVIRGKPAPLGQTLLADLPLFISYTFLLGVGLAFPSCQDQSVLDRHITWRQRRAMVPMHAPFAPVSNSRYLQLSRS